MVGAGVGMSDPMREFAACASRRSGFDAAARWRWLAPCAIGLLALALRLHGLGNKPFWLDEIASLRRATMPLHDIVGESLRSNHYPAYFLLLWAVGKIATTQFVLRLPSAIFGAICAGLVCAIGRAADGARTGVAAGLLLALSPFDVQLGQEARSYTLVACLILVAMWGLVWIARDPAVAAYRWRRDRPLPPAAWLAYGIGTLAALNVLNVAIAWFIAANLAAIVIAKSAGAGGAAFLRNWAVAQGLIAAAWLPVLIAVYVVSGGGVLGAAGWVPPLTPATVWSLVAPVYLHRIATFITFDLFPSPVPGLSLVIAALAAHGAWRLRRAPAVLAIVAGAGVLLPLLLLAVSLYKPLLVPRYFAWSAAPFFILAGAALGSLSRGRFAAGAAALAAACLINLLPYYHAETKPRWDLAAAALGQAAHDGDIVLLNSWYSHYVMTAFAERSEVASRKLLLTWNPADAAKLPPNHDLWVILGRAGQTPMPTAADYIDSLSALGRPLEERQIGRYITMWRFAPSAVVAECAKPSGCDGATPATAKP
jgi:mannosyltransferase